MIRISLGNPGSGKTAMEVWEMYHNRSNRKIYSNISTKIKNQYDINPSMIINKEIIKVKAKTNEPVYKLTLNKEFWQGIKEPINVVLDEAHSIINARRSISNVNIIVTDWLALIRRVLGQSDSGYGELVLITQLPNRIDCIARDMATQVRYHICHYVKTCLKCGFSWAENSELPEPLWICPNCDCYKVKKHSHSVEVWHFPNMFSYTGWKDFGMTTFYKHYIVNDIEKIFPLYNTLQWDNMFSEIYT